MYAVQLFVARKYQTVTGPSSLSGAFDNYTAHVRSRAESGTMVRLVKVVKTDKGLQTVALRSAKALGLSPAVYFHVSNEKATKKPLTLAVKHLVPHAPKVKANAAKSTAKNHTARKAG